MYRFIKHMPTNTIHSYEPSWMSGDNHGFVECDEQGNILNIVDSTAEEVTEAPKAPPKKKAAPAKVAVETVVAEEIIGEDPEDLLSIDASRGL